MEKKKIIKNVLKIALIVIAILLVILIIHTIRNYVIVTDLQNKIAEYNGSTNYHIKSVANVVDEDYTTTLDYYVKDNKQVSIMEKSIDGKVKLEEATIKYDEKRGFINIENKDSNFKINTTLVYGYLKTEEEIQIDLETILLKIKRRRDY